MTKVLEVRNLSFSIEDKKIVDNVFISLEKHKILALLGQSGSGKSTILKLLAGLLEPDFGKLEIDSERIIPPSEKLIAGHPKIKIVRQDNPLFPNISLRENIEYELRFFNENYRRERVDKLLKVTGLKKVADQLPRHSSEGEQQRTAIARALADEPSLLLLDEPFSNLDYKNKSNLKEEIKQLVSEENMACVFVTHDISDVFGTADELAILKKGKITQQGEPLEVYHHPKSVYETSITGDYNLISKAEAKKVLGIETKAKKIMIRPESVQIVSDGAIEAEIVRVLSKGVYNEVSLNLKGLKLTSFNTSSFEAGQRVSLNIKTIKEFY